MPRRRITRTLGAAAGGLLGFAFLPAAAALADDYDVTPDTSSTETVTGIYGYGFDGLGTAPPALAGTVQGDQLFDYSDVTTVIPAPFPATRTHPRTPWATAMLAFM